MTLLYEVRIRPLSSTEGGGYLAEVPELPGCMSDGESPEEALSNVRDAIEAWVDAAQAAHQQVPAPRLAAAE